VGQDWREQLLGIEPEYHNAAEALLSKLDNAPNKCATRSQLLGTSRAKGPLEAFAKLVEAGVLVEIGGTTRSPAFAVDRGEATAKLETSAKPRAASPRAAKAPPVPKAPRATKPKGSDDAVPLARQEILERLATSSAPWLPKAQLCGTSASVKAAYQQLIQDGSIVELGKLGNVVVVTRGRGHAADVLRELAVEVIVTRGTRDALTALPIEPSDPFWKGSLPKQVEGSFQLALRSLLASKRALKLDGAGARLFVLADSIQAAAAELGVRTTPSVEREPPAPSAVASSGLDSERVRRAYRSLATRQRAPHVTIADLWRDSGAPLPALKSWLLAECRAHRADPALGEPSLATPEQLAAALEIDGRPHLYIQLENP
jgi:hypothetical protein